MASRFGRAGMYGSGEGFGEALAGMGGDVGEDFLSNLAGKAWTTGKNWLGGLFGGQEEETPGLSYLTGGLSGIDYSNLAGGFA